MTDPDPFELLAMPDTEWPPGTEYPVMDAVKCFDPANPSPLIKLLQSSDPITNGHGLSVFGWIGRKSAVVLDEALKLNQHPDDMARNAMMDGVMCYSEALTANQAIAVLQLIDDPFCVVREKIIIFLAHADSDALGVAIGSLDEPLRSEHREGFELLHATHSEPQHLFDEAVARNDIWSAYAFASLARMARLGALETAPEYAGDDYVAEGVVAHIKTHIARRDRKRRGGRYRSYDVIMAARALELASGATKK
jgi:hypothetical protein